MFRKLITQLGRPSRRHKLASLVSRARQAHAGLRLTGLCSPSPRHPRTRRYERPYGRSEVLASYTVYSGRDASGEVLAEATAARLRVERFKESWVECAHVVADALSDMLAGEKAELLVEPDATGLDDGEHAFVELELHQILREVSKLQRPASKAPLALKAKGADAAGGEAGAKDKPKDKDKEKGEAGLYLQRREGSRNVRVGRAPLPMAVGACQLRLVRAVDGALQDAGVKPAHFGVEGAAWPEVGEWWDCEYEVGDGELAEGLDEAIQIARDGELWHVTMRGEHCFPDLPVDSLPKDADVDPKLWEGTVELELRQGEFEGGGKGIDMKIDVKVKRGETLKKRGNALFKAGRVRRAEANFAEGADLFNVIQSEDFDHTGENVRYNRLSEKHQRPLLLNVALCKIRRGAHADAVTDLNEVLLHDSSNVKALYRRGLVHLELENYNEAKADLEKAAHIDVSLRREVEKEITRLKRKMNEAAVAEKKAYRHLFDTSKNKELVYTEEEIAASEATGKNLPHYKQPTHVEKALRIDDLDAEFAEIDEEEAKRAKMREQAKKQYYTGGRVMSTQGGFGMGV